MPNYLQFNGSKNNGTGCVSIRCTTKDIKCMSAINFLDTLSTKLLDMTKSLQLQFDEFKRIPVSQEAGFILASVNAPKMTLGVKYEYIIYIQRYGPPSTGIFDEEILIQLRTELGIDNSL